MSRWNAVHHKPDWCEMYISLNHTWAHRENGTWLCHIMLCHFSVSCVINTDARIMMLLHNRCVFFSSENFLAMHIMCSHTIRDIVIISQDIWFNEWPPSPSSGWSELVFISCLCLTWALSFFLHHPGFQIKKEDPTQSLYIIHIYKINFCLYLTT